MTWHANYIGQLMNKKHQKVKTLCHPGGYFTSPTESTSLRTWNTRQNSKSTTKMIHSRQTDKIGVLTALAESECF